MEGESYHIRLSEGRRVVLPANVCKVLNADIGDTLLLRVENDSVRFHSLNSLLEDFRGKLREKLGDRSIVDELIAERRAEAARE